MEMKGWKNRFRNGFVLLLTAALIGSCTEGGSLSVWAKARNDGAGLPETFSETVSTEEELLEPEELLEGYLYQQAYEELGVETSFFGNVGGTRLSGEEKKIYDALKGHIEKVAKGEETSTEVKVEGLAISGTETEVSDSVRKVMSYLLMDCPYDFYWYNKTNGYKFTYQSGGSSSVTFFLAVSAEYQGTSEYTVNSAKTKAAAGTVAKAKSIVTANQNKTDYEKLKAYLDEIKRLVSYNNQAVGSGYGNPWQLIWVFDGDSSTNVVCEGYAKAFQYLCDLSAFYDAACYTVTGMMGSGNHMWNIVTLKGKNYLVDVTNCDAGTVGDPEQLFLTGTQGSVQNGYSFSLSGGQTVTYRYDDNQSGLLGDVLSLASAPYQDQPGSAVTIQIPPSVKEVTFGDEVDSSDLMNGAVKDAGGNVVTGSFQWANNVTFYGEAGKNQLNAVFIPSDSQYSPVGLSVDVTVKKKPIMVTADAKSKAYGQPDPEFTYTAEGVLENYPLTGSLTRKAGESMGTYAIEQGSLTNAENPNYDITFQGSNLEITAADYTVTVSEKQNIRPGSGEFTEPVFTDESGNPLVGTLTYTYNNQSYTDYNSLKTVLAALKEGDSGTISYTFEPADQENYSTKEGSISFTVSSLEFLVGTSPATAANAVTIKADAVYGDAWSDIVKLGAITAKAGNEEDSDPGSFGLRDSGIPKAGSGQRFQVVYNGTIGGKTYTNEPVLTGTADIGKRPLTLAAGSCKITKVYDKTRDPGTADGSLLLNNLLPEDEGQISTAIVPAPYTDPNVNGQSRITVTVGLSGAAVSNYELSGNTVEIPCEITPKPITPGLKVSGSYTYTGTAVTPTVTVTDGSDVLAESDYEIALSNNQNAGTAKVAVTPKADGNYTWSPAVEATFPIDKAGYTGTKAMSVTAGYGASATFNIASMLPAGYQLGAIRVEDRDQIFSGTPSISGTNVSCTIVNDSAKVGRSAVITIPVTGTTDYQAFEATLTVTVAANQNSSNNNNSNNNNSSNNNNNNSGSGSDGSNNNAEKVNYSLNIDSKITSVPQALGSMEDLNTPAKIEAQMKAELKKRAAGLTDEHTVVYDVVLMVNINGGGWKTATKENFPSNGLTVVIPYPEGTDRTKHDFIVSHMFTEEMNGHKPGEIEYPSVTKTTEGLEFKVNGLSPISIGWTEAGKLNTASTGVKSPKTADNSPVAMYLSLMALSITIPGFLWRRERKKSHQ